MTIMNTYHPRILNLTTDLGQSTGITNVGDTTISQAPDTIRAVLIA